MADFKETLSVCRNKTASGYPTLVYNYCITKEDLADNTFQVIDFEECVTLGEACKIIDDFCGSSLEDRKLTLRAFMETDKITLEEEY